MAWVYEVALSLSLHSTPSAGAPGGRAGTPVARIACPAPDAAPASPAAAAFHATRHARIRRPSAPPTLCLPPAAGPAPGLPLRVRPHLLAFDIRRFAFHSSQPLIAVRHSAPPARRFRRRRCNCFRSAVSLHNIIRPQRLCQQYAGFGRCRDNNKRV